MSDSRLIGETEGGSQLVIKGSSEVSYGLEMTFISQIK
jgi:hypothetical protein